jgi:hypothetical protein
VTRAYFNGIGTEPGRRTGSVAEKCPGGTAVVGPPTPAPDVGRCRRPTSFRVGTPLLFRFDFDVNRSVQGPNNSARSSSKKPGPITRLPNQRDRKKSSKKSRNSTGFFLKFEGIDR